MTNDDTRREAESVGPWMNTEAGDLLDRLGGMTPDEKDVMILDTERAVEFYRGCIKRLGDEKIALLSKLHLHGKCMKLGEKQKRILEAADEKYQYRIWLKRSHEHVEGFLEPGDSLSYDDIVTVVTEMLLFEHKKGRLKGDSEDQS